MKTTTLLLCLCVMGCGQQPVDAAAGAIVKPLPTSSQPSPLDKKILDKKILDKKILDKTLEVKTEIVAPDMIQKPPI